MVTPQGIEQVERHAEDSAAARRAIRAAMDFPEFQPPVRASHVGSDGGLWLRREETEAATFTWIVLDAELRPVGRVGIPKGHRLLWSSGDQLWAVETDPLGIPWLVRYRLEPTG